MQVLLCSGDAGVAEAFLDDLKVGTAVQEPGCVGVAQVVDRLIFRVAAPSGASVVGSMAKQVARLVQPAVPVAKSPLVRIFGPRVPLTAGAARPPSTTVWATENELHNNEVVNTTTMRIVLLSSLLANDRVVNEV